MKNKSLSISLLLVAALFCYTVVSCSDDDPQPATSTTETEPGPVEEPEPDEPETEEPEPTIVPDGTINGYEYVDMGLSVMWATCAVSASSPEELSVTRATGDIDYGDYYAWGEIEPKEEYTSDNSFTYGIGWFKDITADPRYDAATANWGSPWRMPTKDEMQELIDNCEWKWITLNGVNGMLVTSEINDNIIFLPATGWRSGSSLYISGDDARYWTSTPSDNSDTQRASQTAYYLLIGSNIAGGNVQMNNSNSRYLGCTVWPVAAPAPFDLQNPSDEPGNINGYDYVSLGLSVRWAAYNIGASSPEEYGNYYAWGEIETKEDYLQETSLTWEKEMEDITGDPNYDAATANWGAPWRMPTQDEMQELIDYCTTEWVTQNGVNGRLVTSKINGNSIFLPAAGNLYHVNNTSSTRLYNAGEEGVYWTSTPSNDGMSAAVLWFADDFFNGAGGSRACGFSVRPVIE